MIIDRTASEIAEVLYTYALFMFCIRYNDGHVEWFTNDRLAECYGEKVYDNVRETAFRMTGQWHKFEV
jgi:hypothetical protein